MPTHKHRINLSVPHDIDQAIHKLALRDRISLSGKTLDLIKHALEIEEDGILLKIAEGREAKKGKLISHEKAWG